MSVAHVHCMLQTHSNKPPRRFKTTMTNEIIFKREARQLFLDEAGNVDWDKIQSRWNMLREIKESLGNKHFSAEVLRWAQGLPQSDQQHLLNIMLGGLCNEDASVGVYATRPEDYELFGTYLEPIIREYHKISGDTKQSHDWNIPVGEYILSDIHPSLANVSMRARVARNVTGWNLPSSMSKDERLKFESFMEEVFAKLPFPGTYRSMTVGHTSELSSEEAEQMRKEHMLFNDMTTDNHLTSSGIASDWPHGRGIWFSEDKTKMIWVGEEDHLRIISIVHGNDLGAVDKSLSDLLQAMENVGVSFAKHPIYGIITTCPTNMGTGKRQSILGHFPNITEGGTNESKLKELARKFGLQARGLSGEHSKMDARGTADISPLARFGVTEAEVTRRLNNGLKELFAIENTQ